MPSWYVLLIFCISNHVWNQGELYCLWFAWAQDTGIPREEVLYAERWNSLEWLSSMAHKWLLEQSVSPRKKRPGSYFTQSIGQVSVSPGTKWKWSLDLHKLVPPRRLRVSFGAMEIRSQVCVTATNILLLSSPLYPLNCLWSPCCWHTCFRRASWSRCHVHRASRYLDQ